MTEAIQGWFLDFHMYGLKHWEGGVSMENVVLDLSPSSFMIGSYLLKEETRGYQEVPTTEQ